MSMKLSPNKMLDTNRQFFFSLLFSLQHFPLSHKVNYKSSAHFDMHWVTVWLVLAYSDFYSGLLTSAFISFSTMKITRYYKWQMLGRRPGYEAKNFYVLYIV